MGRANGKCLSVLHADFRSRRNFRWDTPSKKTRILGAQKPMRIRVCALVIGALLAAVCLFGQASDGNITGTVLDASGAAIPSATVQLENVATGVKLTTKT